MYPRRCDRVGRFHGIRGGPSGCRETRRASASRISAGAAGAAGASKAASPVSGFGSTASLRTDSDAGGKPPVSSIEGLPDSDDTIIDSSRSPAGSDDVPAAAMESIDGDSFRMSVGGCAGGSSTGASGAQGGSPANSR